jgi:hypothetical protein
MSQIKQCEYIISKTNEQCKRNADIDSNYCWQHKEIIVSELIPELEDLMSEYTDYNTYQQLIKYNPSKYSMDKYEIKIANVESERQHHLLASTLSKLGERKYINETEKRNIFKDELMNLAFENIESTLKIMNELEMLEYEGEEGNEVFGSYAGHQGNIKIGVKLLLNPKGYDNLSGLRGNITLSEDGKGLLFSGEDEIFEYSLSLTPLYKLLYENIETYVSYI